MADTAPSLAAAVGRGAVLGFVLIVPITVVTAITVDTAPDDQTSGWRIPLFFLLLAAFAVAGGAAGRALPVARFTAGILAGLGAFALWIPVRVGIWWARADDRGLFTGADGVLRPGQLFAAALFACALGFLGGMFGPRLRRRGTSP